MKKSTLITCLLYFIAFVLPFLGMSNCDGYNEASMAVTSCVCDGPFFRSYANFYYGLVLLSVFLFVPFFIYVGATILLVRFIARWIDK